MKGTVIVVVALLGGAGMLSASPLDDQIKAFEEAVKAAPLAQGGFSPGMSSVGRIATVQDLDLMIQRGDNEAGTEQVVTQLMATHPSDKVQKTGEAVILELEAHRRMKEAALAAKASTVLAAVPNAVTHARKASDLDDIRKELQALQNPQEQLEGNEVFAESGNTIGAAFQFVTQWQDYLSASGSGNWQEAQNALHNILENRQINAPSYIPRSEILAKMEEARAGGPKIGGGASGRTADDPNVILPTVKKPEDFSKVLPQLYLAPTAPSEAPWDWSPLIALDKARMDAEAGLPVTLDLHQVMNGGVWGEDISRIVAMELLEILPYYLGTKVAYPPKPKETVVNYLDRLSATASQAGDLALLQRAITMKVALGTARMNMQALGTQQFLAGLSQEAAGQYAQAISSYQNALKQSDEFLPSKVVGERLAAIRTAHPDEFEKGMTLFTSSASTGFNNRPGMPPFYPGQLGYPYGMPQISVLPIPMEISIPARVNPPATSPASQPASK